MQTLRGIAWNHTRGWAPMALTSQVFCDHHPDVSIHWERQSLFDFGEGHTAELADSYDLMVIDHPMVPVMAASGCFHPFAEADVIPAVGRSAETYAWQGAMWALPIDAACQVSVTRSDLLRAAGKSAPATWGEVLALAENPGRVVMPMTPINLFCALLTLCAEHGARAGVSSESFLDPDSALDSLELLRRLRDAVPLECAATNPIGTLEAMAHTDGPWYCPLIFGYSNYSRAGYAPRLLDFGGIPALEDTCTVGQGSVLGGAGLAVSAGSRVRELAAEYALWVSSELVQRTEYMRSGGQPAAAAAWDDAEANRATNGFFRATRATIEGGSPRPSSAGYPRFQTEAAALLHSSFFGDERSRRILDDIESLYTRYGCLS